MVERISEVSKKAFAATGDISVVEVETEHADGLGTNLPAWSHFDDSGSCIQHREQYPQIMGVGCQQRDLLV